MPRGKKASKKSATKKGAKKKGLKKQSAKKASGKSTKKVEKSGRALCMFVDTPANVGVPVFRETVVDLPRAVIHGNWMIQNGHARNVWFIEAVEYLS